GFRDGGGLEKITELRDVARSGVTLIGSDEAEPIPIKLRNGGVVSIKLEYDPPRGAISSAPTGPLRLWPIRRYLPGGNASIRYSPDASVTLPAATRPVSASSAKTWPPNTGCDCPGSAFAISFPEITPVPRRDPYKARTPAMSS